MKKFLSILFLLSLSVNIFAGDSEGASEEKTGEVVCPDIDIAEGGAAVPTEDAGDFAKIVCCIHYTKPPYGHYPHTLFCYKKNV